MTSIAKRGPAGEMIGHTEVLIETIDEVIARIQKRREMCSEASVAALTRPYGMTDRMAWMAAVSTPAMD